MEELALAFQACRLKVCNFSQAYFIKSDLAMYDESQDCPALVRSTNLCHELGQVSYIFSDKTGTLTQNIMDLKRVSIGNMVFGEVGCLLSSDVLAWPQRQIANCSELSRDQHNLASAVSGGVAHVLRRPCMDRPNRGLKRTCLAEDGPGSYVLPWLGMFQGKSLWGTHPEPILKQSRACSATRTNSCCSDSHWACLW